MRHSADMRSKQPNKVAIRQIDEGRLVRGLLSFRVIALLRMSAIGPKRTSLVALHMSAFGGKADMTFCAAHVCF
jgi:hypothetical protein